MPDADWNQGSLARTCQASTELLQVLVDDARVRTAFQWWAAQCGLTPDRFTRAAHGDAAARQELIIGARRAPEHALATMAALAHDVLHLPYRWPTRSS